MAKVRKNRYEVAKEIAIRFYCEFDLVITREMALEVMSSLKDNVAVWRNGRYTSTRTTDYILNVYPSGSVRSYNTSVYTRKEWNEAVKAGVWGGEVAV